jgi:tetratricopeptide (TPR) repeat protein
VNVKSKVLLSTLSIVSIFYLVSLLETRLIKTHPPSKRISANLAPKLEEPSNQSNSSNLKQDVAKPSTHTPNDLDASSKLENEALQNLKENNSENAEDLFLQALEKDPNNSVALGELIFSLQSKGKNEEAKETVQNILSRCSKCGEAHLTLAEIYMNEGHYQEAIKELEDAARDPSILEAAQRKLQTAYLKLGDRTQAQAVLVSIIRRSEMEIERIKAQGVLE